MTLNPLRQGYDVIYTALTANADILALFIAGSDARVRRVPNFNPEGVYYASAQGIVTPNSFDYPIAELTFRPERRYWRGQGQELQNTSDTP